MTLPLPLVFGSFDARCLETACDDGADDSSIAPRQAVI